MKWMLLVLLSATAYLVCAQPTRDPAPVSLSLSDAIQQGLENNYQIRIAANELEVARVNNDHALTGKYPTISLGLSPGIGYRNTSNPASVVTTSSVTSYSVAPSANLNWTLFNGGRIALNKERLETLADLSAGQLQLQVENNVQQIIQAYYNAVVQREQIVALQRVLTLSRDRVDYQRIRKEFGQGGTFDELQARDAYLTDSTNLVRQLTTYNNAIRNLLQVMGSDNPEQSLELTTDLEYEAEGYDRGTLLAQFEATNRTLQNLLINRDLAALNTQLIEAERQPTVGIAASINYDINLQTGSQTFDFGGDQPSREQELPGVAARTLAANLGFTANYLLFDGGNRSVRTQAARLQEITARLDYQSAQQQLRSALLNTLSLYENQAEIVEITQDLIVNAEQNLEIADERFSGGTINSFDYRQIQVQYINAEFQLLNALLNLKNTETELLRVTGQILR